MSDERIPVNTKVQYHGSETTRHGEYIIRAYTDPEILRSIKGDAVVDKYYPDEIAYILWPVGLPHKFGERYNGVLYDVRRQFFTVVEDESWKVVEGETAHSLYNDEVRLVVARGV